MAAWVWGRLLCGCGCASQGGVTELFGGGGRGSFADEADGGCAEEEMGAVEVAALLWLCWRPALFKAALSAWDRPEGRGREGLGSARAALELLCRWDCIRLGVNYIVSLCRCVTAEVWGCEAARHATLCENMPALEVTMPCPMVGAITASV